MLLTDHFIITTYAYLSFFEEIAGKKHHPFTLLIILISLLICPQMQNDTLVKADKYQYHIGKNFDSFYTCDENFGKTKQEGLPSIPNI